MSLRTFLYNPRLPSPPAVEEEKKSSSNEVELSEMREKARKQQEHFYTVMGLALTKSTVSPIFPV